MYQGTVEPFDVIAVWVQDEDLIGDDGDGEKQHGPNGDGQRERAEPGADPVDGDLVIVDAIVVFVAVPFEFAQDREAQQVEQEEEDEEDLRRKR